MLKNSTYKEKFALLTPWMPMILDSIKKDVKNEHLRKDWNFFNRYFTGKNLNKLSLEELATAYSQAITTGENAEELGEFLTNRWLLKHSDLYHYFEQELSKINNNFNELEMLDKELSENMMETAVQHFGAGKTYLFCVLNSVVFPEEVFKVLEKKAEIEASQKDSTLQMEKEERSLEAIERTSGQQIARLTDKYEKKLAGLQKKYVCDVEVLKKQVATLQRKLSASE
jgi:hypothetical protein